MVVTESLLTSLLIHDRPVNNIHFSHAADDLGSHSEELHRPLTSCLVVTHPLLTHYSPITHSLLRHHSIIATPTFTDTLFMLQIISGFTGKSYIDLWPAAILVGGVMLAIGCLTPEQALASIDWTVYITIAFAFGVSSAMENSQVAQAIADVFVALSKWWGHLIRNPTILVNCAGSCH